MKTKIIHIWGGDFNHFQTGPLAFNVYVPLLLVPYFCPVVLHSFVSMSLNPKHLSLWKRNIHRAITGNSLFVMVNMLASGHSVL